MQVGAFIVSPINAKSNCVHFQEKPFSGYRKAIPFFSGMYYNGGRTVLKVQGV
jgi:hypothetical protein